MPLRCYPELDLSENRFHNQSRLLRTPLTFSCLYHLVPQSNFSPIPCFYSHLLCHFCHLSQNFTLPALCLLFPLLLVFRHPKHFIYFFHIGQTNVDCPKGANLALFWCEENIAESIVLPYSSLLSFNMKKKCI